MRKVRSCVPACKFITLTYSNTGTKKRHFMTVLRVPLSLNKKRLLFKLCCFDTNSLAHVTKGAGKSTLGMSLLKWSELMEFGRCCKYFENDDGDSGYKLCVNLLSVAALPRENAKKMISPLSATNMLISEVEEKEEEEKEEEEEEEKEEKNPVKRIVRMFRFPSEKSSSLLVTESLSEVPYVVFDRRILQNT